MKAGLPSQGFTIIEVMIFLVVSVALLASALALISGKQAETEFTQAIRDINAQITTTISDTATGFFPGNATFNCAASGSGPIIGATSSGQGTNEGCIFIGKVMQFGLGGNGGAGTGVSTYTVAGLRQHQTPTALQEVTTLNDAKPKAIAPPTSPIDVTVTSNLEYGLQATRMLERRTVSGIMVNRDIAAVGFMSSFAQYNQGSIVTGAQSTDLVTVPTFAVTSPPSSNDLQHTSSSTVVTAITAMTDNNKNPDGGIIICFKGGNGKTAAIVIGSKGQQTTTNLLIDQVDPAWGCP